MAKGPKRESTRESFWRQLIQRQAGSGSTIRAWCRKHSVQEASFYWWRRELDRRGGGRRGPGDEEVDRHDADRPEPVFVPVSARGGAGVLGASAEAEIEILLANDQRIRVRGPVSRPGATALSPRPSPAATVTPAWTALDVSSTCTSSIRASRNRRSIATYTATTSPATAPSSW